jgi:hypothetical protein
MANALYVAYRNGVLGAHATYVDLDANTINVALIDHGVDTPNVTTDDFYDDINAGLIDTVETLASKTIGTVAAGVFDAANVTFTAVTGASVESVNIFKDTGTPATSNLIAYFDTGTGLPVTPNGGDITVTWNASGIFTF